MKGVPGRIFLNFHVWTAVLLLLVLISGCQQETGEGKQGDQPLGSDTRPAFLLIGAFSVHRISDTRTEVRDGAGRTLTLIPRGAPLPADCDPGKVVRTPVRRVAAYGYFDVATLRMLGVLDEVLVGVTVPEKEWAKCSTDIAQGMREGRIAYLGDASSIDFERLKHMEPDLVLTWDPSSLPLLDDLHIPAVITSTPQATCLNARIRYVQFLAPFFGREKEADAYFARIDAALKDIRARTAGAGEQPKVMWGDIYEKRVMVEPGNAWVGELVGLAQSSYQFEDVFGTSCIEISVERFLYSGENADIFFTYRTRESGATSKAAIARLNPLIRDIAPLHKGKVVAPLPCYIQSMDKLDEILTEISAILHPDCYPGYILRYFEELPDVDPADPSSGQSEARQ
ncbi:MAG: ABC transporter substrate-binding protein [Desulfobulbus sp.]|jgi:iron complex transport system substrate-binding protein